MTDGDADGSAVGSRRPVRAPRGPPGPVETPDFLRICVYGSYSVPDLRPPESCQARTCRSGVRSDATRVLETRVPTPRPVNLNATRHLRDRPSEMRALTSSSLCARTSVASATVPEARIFSSRAVAFRVDSSQPPGMSRVHEAR